MTATRRTLGDVVDELTAPLTAEQRAWCVEQARNCDIDRDDECTDRQILATYVRRYGTDELRFAIEQASRDHPTTQTAHDTKERNVNQAAATVTQIEIPHAVDVDDLRAQLANAQQTIEALSAQIEQLDPADGPDTLDELLVGASELLRRVPMATGPIELLGSGARSDVEQLTATALAVLADARARLATSILGPRNAVERVTRP